jgi:hypothetical protein
MTVFLDFTIESFYPGWNFQVVNISVVKEESHAEGCGKRDAPLGTTKGGEKKIC